MKSLWGPYSIIELINQGMDLTRRDPFQNGTILHFWAGTPYCDLHSDQENSLAVVKLLVEKGADLQALDKSGFTPLLGAANGRMGKCPNLVVLDHLLERDCYSRGEKIEAMELAGAVILSNEQNDSQFHKAFDYWRKAVQLRLDKGCGPIQKTLLNLKSVRTTEWITSAELEDVIGHPEKYVIQSFLVRLRIFSYKSWEAIQPFFEFFLLDNIFSELRQQRRFVELFDIFWAMLEIVSRFDSCEKPSVQRMTEKVIGKLVWRLTCLGEGDFFNFWNAEIIKTSLELMVSATVLHHVDLYLFFRLVEMFFLLPEMLNSGALKSLSELRDQRGQNLLHKACILHLGELGLYYNIRFLLNAGCDSNAIDGDGNAPLHLLAQLDERRFSDLNKIAHLLLDFGAQLSRQNGDGKTAVDLWIQKNGRKNRDDDDREIIGWKVPDWCSELPTLKCLSARVIRCNRIPHLGLPATLIPVIEKHKITI